MFQVVFEYQEFKSKWRDKRSRGENRHSEHEEERRRYEGEHVPRGQWHEIGAREVEWCPRVDDTASPRSSMEDVTTKVEGSGNVKALLKERSWNPSQAM